MQHFVFEGEMDVYAHETNNSSGQTVGIREVADEIWLVSFMDYDLGFFDKEQGRVEPALNPFAPEKVLTMSPE